MACAITKNFINTHKSKHIGQFTVSFVEANMRLIKKNEAN